MKFNFLNLGTRSSGTAAARAITLAAALAITVLAATLAQAQVSIPLPDTSAVATNKVYLCTKADGSAGGAVAISIDEETLWFLETTQNQTGLPMKLERILQARCPHTYDFIVDFMGEKQNGELAGGCAGGDATFKLSRTPTDFMEFNCVYKP